MNFILEDANGKRTWDEPEVASTTSSFIFSDLNKRKVQSNSSMTDI